MAGSPLMTAEEVRQYLGFRSVRSVYRRAQSGELSAIKLSHNAFRFRQEDVESFLEEHPVAAQND